MNSLGKLWDYGIRVIMDIRGIKSMRIIGDGGKRLRLLLRKKLCLRIDGIFEINELVIIKSYEGVRGGVRGWDYLCCRFLTL